MKQLLAVVCLGMLLVGATLTAQTTPTPAPVPEGMGTKVIIGSPVDLNAVDRSYLNAPDVVNLRSRNIPVAPWIISLAWHPDGKYIFYTDGDYIFSVPVEGGNPRLVFESYYIHPYQGKRYVLVEKIYCIDGFSPDGRYLYISRQYIGPESNATITINSTGTGGGVSNGYRVLDRLDLQTGQVQTIDSNTESSFATLSHSGKYVAHDGYGKVIDTVSLEKWTLPIPLEATPVSGHNTICFIGDSHLLFSQTFQDTTLQLFRIPIRGGEQELVATISSGVIDYNNPPDCSSDGEWVLYPVNTGEAHSNSITRTNGAKRSYSKSVMKLCTVNLRTGAVSNLLPVSKTIDPICPRYSTDGKKVCYIFRNWEGADFSNEWHIYIKDFAPADAFTPLDVAETAPVPFALTGNYPNPFNPSTTIEFSLAAPGQANLSVYDVTGRKVRELVNRSMVAGKHSAVWDGRDDRGIVVSSGIYITRLAQGEKVVSRRMLLVK